MLKRILMALVLSAATVYLPTACTLFSRDVVLAGKVIEMQGENALISVHSTANAKPGQRLTVYKINLVPAVKPTAPPWRRPEKTGTAVISEVIGDHAVRVSIESGSISSEGDVELRN